VDRLVAEHWAVVLACRRASGQGGKAGRADHTLVQLGWPSGGVSRAEGEEEVGLECLMPG
jgi:hypothetical protein